VIYERASSEERISSALSHSTETMSIGCMRTEVTKKVRGMRNDEMARAGVFTATLEIKKILKNLVCWASLHG
jgi:hypothetical protein